MIGRHKGFTWDQLPAILWALIIIVASSIPASSFPESSIWRWDKVIHFCIYAILTALVNRAFALQTRFPTVSRLALPFTLLAVVAFGVSDEFHQYFVPGRTASVMDVVADAAGALFVLAMVLWLGRRQRAAN